MALFGNKVSHPIGAPDMEFYEGGIVLRLALILSGYSEEEWNKVSHRTRNRWLDRAVKAACDLFNEKDVAMRLLPLGRNLMGRI